MKSRQVVGIVLGLILVLLAIMGHFMGFIDISTSNGQISFIAALALGIIIIASSFVDNKAKESSSTTSITETACPNCGRPVSTELDHCPECETVIAVSDDRPIRDIQRHGLSQKQSVLVTIIAIVVVVILVALFMEGSLLGQGEEWNGTCTYYYLDFYGDRDSMITGTCQLSFDRNGDSVSGILDIYPTSQVNVGSPGYIPAVEEHIQFEGTGNSTSIKFYTEAYIGPGGYEEVWEFTITDNGMLGKVTNLDTYAYLGLDSDPGAFILSK